MKTFIAALIIFALLFASVLLVSGFARGSISSLLSLAEALPEAYESGAVEKVQALHSEWERNMRLLQYLASYDILVSAGEAADALTAVADTESADDFASARLRFIASMRRLAMLFSVSAESVL